MFLRSAVKISAQSDG